MVDIKQLFLDLTKHTVPDGKEKQYLKGIVPDFLKEDKHGNWYYKVGDGKNSVMFTSHTDTVGGDVPVKHVIDGNRIKSDGKTNLGADDKAGVALMLYMIDAGKPGLYYFFHGEEVGCRGSRALAEYVEKNKDKDELFKDITQVVSFDRKGYTSVITYQSGERCCSDEYANALAKALNDTGGFQFKIDTGGILTDSVHFTEIYPECTNLSVGYFDHHMHSESQDIDFLEKLAIACCKVDWEGLPIKRDPKAAPEKLYKSYYGGGGGRYYNEWDNEYDYDYWGGGSGGYRNTRGGTASRGKKASTTGNVIDYRGKEIPASDAVWCEYDKVYCNRKDAIWEDIVGFYTTPDSDFEPTEDTKLLPATTKSRELIESVIKPGLEVHHSAFGDGVIEDWDKEKKFLAVKFTNTKHGRKQLFFDIAKMVMKY